MDFGFFFVSQSNCSFIFQFDCSMLETLEKYQKCSYNTTEAITPKDTQVEILVCSSQSICTFLPLSMFLSIYYNVFFMTIYCILFSWCMFRLHMIYFPHHYASLIVNGFVWYPSCWLVQLVMCIYWLFCCFYAMQLQILSFFKH